MARECPGHETRQEGAAVHSESDGASELVESTGEVEGRSSNPTGAAACTETRGVGLDRKEHGHIVAHMAAQCAGTEGDDSQGWRSTEPHAAERGVHGTGTVDA